MKYLYISALFGAAVTTACTIPGGTLSNNITTPFGVLIQNPNYPVIHNKYMNLNAAGGGDRHLFLEPVPDPVRNLTLASGILTWPYGGIHAVINGEVRYFCLLDFAEELVLTWSNTVFRSRQHNQNVHDRAW
jgi:hypothetical protein